MNEQNSARLIATVRGRVQGVGYRYFAQDEANRLGLTGYARNLPNGSVEVVAEGDRRLIDAFLVLLRRGPSSAEVTDIQVQFVPVTGEFRRFSIRPSGD